MAGKNKKNLLSGNEEEQKQQWRSDIQQQDFFKKLSKTYAAASVESWLQHYVDGKYRWLKRLERNEERYEYMQSRWLDSAHDHLEAIQQKKLFDLQCRWRAEQVQLPGIEICYDFELWESNVFNCTFLDPITTEEVDFYTQYLLHPDAQPGYHEAKANLFHWQDYNGLQDARGRNYAIPEWYEYHNQFTGAGSLLSLPDIRGMKERKYQLLAIQSRIDASNAAAVAEDSTGDTKPWMFISAEDEALEQVLDYDGLLVRRARKLYNWQLSRVENEEPAMDMLRDLMEAEEPVPVEAHDNCYTALKKAHRRYQCRMIAAALPQAYEQYIINIQMGIGFSICDLTMSKLQSSRDMWLTELLTGRRVAGEPENLDF